MNCPYCNTKITQEFKCPTCQNSYCSKICLDMHKPECHQKVPKKSIRPSITRSVFMKKGKILRENVPDPYFEIRNFEFVRDKNNKIILLGSGSYGKVVLARSIKDKKYYAIKHIKKSKVLESGQTLDNLYREISIQKSLVHENIVRLYSFNEDKDCSYLIMEFMNNGTLFSEIRKNNGFPEKKAFNYFVQVLSAVYFLHENGLIHRDLKPENLLIDNKGNCKLGDFGWCVDISNGLRGTFCGTYEYMAPEIIKEKAYGSAIDVWSLGILLYELIHGYSPFRAQNHIGNLDNNSDSEEEEDEDINSQPYKEIFKNIIKHNYTIDKDVSNECKDLISKLLASDDKNRIKTKDIFFHPWVMKYEKEYKQEMISKEVKLKKKSSDSVLKENNGKKDNKEHNEQINSIKIGKNQSIGPNSSSIKQASNAKNNNQIKYPDINKISYLNKEEDDENDFCLFSSTNINIDNNGTIDESFKKCQTHNNTSNFLDKEKLFIEQTPTPFDDNDENINNEYKYKNKNNNNNFDNINLNFNDNNNHSNNEVLNAIGILEKSEVVKKENQRKKSQLIKPNENFFTKLFAHFNCGGIVDSNKEKDNQE